MSKNREGKYGREVIVTAMSRAGWKILKLHCDDMQRGIPDYVMWRDDKHTYLVELKVAEDAVSAVDLLDPRQLSVMRSLSWTKDGAMLLWGCPERLGLSILRRKDEWHHYDAIPVTGKAGRLVAGDQLADLIYNHIDPSCKVCQKREPKFDFLVDGECPNCRH